MTCAAVVTAAPDHFWFALLLVTEHPWAIAGLLTFMMKFLRENP